MQDLTVSQTIELNKKYSDSQELSIFLTLLDIGKMKKGLRIDLEENY